MFHAAKSSAVVNLENYRALIAQYAWRAWRKLPPQTRAWIDIEFMVEDAFWFAHHYVLCGQRAQPVKDDEGRIICWRWKDVRGNPWQPGRGTVFGTFLANQLERYFCNYTDWLNHPRRFDGNTISVQAVEQQYSDAGVDFEFERILGLPSYRVDPVNACHVGHAFPLLYRRSSPKLKKRIVEWFVKVEPPIKLHPDTPSFLKIKEEFLRLALIHRLTIDDCRHLYRSPECLDKVSRVIVGVPFDLSNPTPGLDRRLWLQE